MHYLYGPVPSRRLGLSLGISLTLHKTCSFDCVYCQLGKTASTSIEPHAKAPLSDILEELESWLRHNPGAEKVIHYITLSGSGEPTLHSHCGELIVEIKKRTAIPIAVLTNTSLLPDPSVRRGLLRADLVIPSLDAATQEVFERIDRPHQGIRLEDIIEGLVRFRQEYRGRLWLEVMLVKGLNDDLRHIRKLKDVIERIRPNKIQLNSPVRATAYPGVLSVDTKKLKKVREILGPTCEIV